MNLLLSFFFFVFYKYELVLINNSGLHMRMVVWSYTIFWYSAQIFVRSFCVDIPGRCFKIHFKWKKKIKLEATSLEVHV